MLIGRDTLRRGIVLSALAVAVPFAGLLLVVVPAAATPILATAILVLAFEAPVAAVGLFLFAHVATPAYVRVPMPGGFYSPPVSTAILIALIAIAMLACLARAPLPRPPASGGRNLLAALGAFAAIAASSLIDSSTGAEGLAMWTKIFVLPAAALFAIVFACRGLDDIRPLIASLVAGGVVASLYAVLEYALGRNPLLEMYQSEMDVRYFTREVLGDLAYRCFSVYGNPIEFAIVMGMIFPFAAVRTAAADGMRERILFGAAAGVLALGIALSFSRGPMLALLVGSVLLGAIHRKLRPWLIGALLATAASLVVLWPFIGAGISDRIGDVDNMTLRLKLWETAVAVFAEHPLRGVGIGNFPNYYLEAARQEHIGPFHEFGAGSVVAVRVAENTYLQLAAETGLIGTAAGIATLMAILLLSVRLARGARDRRSRDLATAIAISIVIYCINGLFVTAYTLYFGTLLLMGFLPACLVVIDRVEAAIGKANTAECSR